MKIGMTLVGGRDGELHALATINGKRYRYSAADCELAEFIAAAEKAFERIASEPSDSIPRH